MLLKAKQSLSRSLLRARRHTLLSQKNAAAGEAVPENDHVLSFSKGEHPLGVLHRKEHPLPVDQLRTFGAAHSDGIGLPPDQRAAPGKPAAE